MDCDRSENNINCPKISGKIYLAHGCGASNPCRWTFNTSYSDRPVLIHYTPIKMNCERDVLKFNGEDICSRKPFCMLYSKSNCAASHKQDNCSKKSLGKVQPSMMFWTDRPGRIRRKFQIEYTFIDCKRTARKQEETSSIANGTSEFTTPSVTSSPVLFRQNSRREETSDDFTSMNIALVLMGLVFLLALAVLIILLLKRRRRHAKSKNDRTDSQHLQNITYGHTLDLVRNYEQSFTMQKESPRSEKRIHAIVEVTPEDLNEQTRGESVEMSPFQNGHIRLNSDEMLENYTFAHDLVHSSDSQSSSHHYIFGKDPAQHDLDDDHPYATINSDIEDNSEESHIRTPPGPLSYIPYELACNVVDVSTLVNKLAVISAEDREK